MNLTRISRIIGLIILGVVGWQTGDALSQEFIFKVPVVQLPPLAPNFGLAAFGALIGFLLTPWLTIRPLTWINREVRRVPIQTLVAAVIGLAVGLLLSALIAVPLHYLPLSLGRLMPFVAALLFGYVGILAAVSRQADLMNLLNARFPVATKATKSNYVILDTSVIIDGRIADIAKTGFIEGTLLVPRFVLNELQHIADSSDTLRRNRGRRGLEILNQLQKHSDVPIEIADLDVPEASEVDSKLIRLGKQLNAPVITNDYNLNRVAELQGVRVLNINELANAVKAVVLPGETIRVRIIQEGKEFGQGVGYLDDGTMVVVEDGKRYINNTMEVTVTRVLQTVAGRMIFATPNGSAGS
ncbi:MAG: TRAM domain-containing protein [Chloroflexi bacterium]|nr:MAG: TRAM domain-containing protein [Chloroflexota bacterium]